MPLSQRPVLLAIALVATGWGCAATGPDQATVSNPPPQEVAEVTASAPANPSPPPEPSPAAGDTPSAPPIAAQASAEPTLPNYFFANDQGVAIAGTDPVAYFTQGEPTPGSPEFATQWGGVTWQFSSAENLALFEASPAAYAPQYGGYCAWAVSQGYTAAIDPNAWTIVDDRLYLNFNTQIQRRWEADIPGFIGKANQNWPDILNQS